jgi:hypothetical protein
MAVRNRVCGPTQCGITALTPRCTKSGCKLDGGQRMPGAGLSCRRSRKVPLGKPAFQPYWGKPAVRNDREDRGNVGIIRSPLRASILPDYIRVMCGRRPRCKKNLTFGLRSGASHVSGLFARHHDRRP